MNNFRIKNNPEKRSLRKKQRKQGANSMRAHQAFLNRRAMRHSELGRLTEKRVTDILAQKLEAGELISFTPHPANSPEDKAGKDFTVSMAINDEVVSASFGITITPGAIDIRVPLIVIPHNMADERIWYTISKIYQKQASNV